MNGKVLYAGEFANGIYNGGGKLFDINGTLLYDGTFVNGRFMEPPAPPKEQTQPPAGEQAETP